MGRQAAESMSQDKVGRKAPGRVWLPAAALAAAGFFVSGPVAARADAVAVSSAAARSAGLASEPSEPKRFSAGINYAGGQLRWDTSPSWAAELRLQTGSASSTYGNVRATVPSLRAYRFFRPQQTVRPFLGAEGGYVYTDSSNSFGITVTGPTFGVFGGMEWRVARRLDLGVSVGPYGMFLSSKQSQPGTNPTLQFVVDTYLLLRLF
jgi:hypothetical protein